MIGKVLDRCRSGPRCLSSRLDQEKIRRASKHDHQLSLVVEERDLMQLLETTGYRWVESLCGPARQGS